jgi:hypothetical protein
MKPTPIALFAFYHLGLDSDGTYKFRNIHDAARRFGATAEEVRSWLAEYRLDADTVAAVPFQLAQAHTDAMMVALSGDAEAVRAHALATYGEYVRALESETGTSFHFSIDYDDIWGDARASTPTGR